MKRSVETISREAQLPRGAQAVSFGEFIDLLAVARSAGYVVSAVEGFEKECDARRMRMDATFSYSDDRQEIDWDQKVKESVAYARQMLNEVPDREVLTYTIWISTLS